MFLYYPTKSDSTRTKPLRVYMLTVGQVNTIRLSLSAESTIHSAVFFSHNKSANCTFYHALSAKRTRLGSLALGHLLELKCKMA